jgi:hypothetical protein
MTIVAQLKENREKRTARDVVAALHGKKCWNVACGGSVGSTFQLALGGKVPRERPLKNPTVSSEYRQYEGQVGLMVWCSWRLEMPSGPLTSSDDESPRMESGLRRLAGKTVRRVSISDGWFLRIEFSMGLILSVFPDHVGANASFDGNWEVWAPGRLYAVGTDVTCEIEARKPLVVQPHANSSQKACRGRVLKEPVIRVRPRGLGKPMPKSRKLRGHRAGTRTGETLVVSS